MKLTKGQRFILQEMANGELLWNAGRYWILRPSYRRVHPAILRGLHEFIEMNQDSMVGGCVLSPAGRAALDEQS